MPADTSPDIIATYRDGELVAPTQAERRAMRYRVHYLNPERVWGRFGWWYRFWLRLLTGTTFERVDS